MKKRIVSLLLALSMCLAPFSIAFALPNITVQDPGLTNGMTTGVGKVIGLVKTIGYVVAIIMVMYVGIKYLTAGAGKKAEVKDTLIPILIGAVLVVSAVTIVEWAFTLGG